MRELTLKELAPYLPYGLRIREFGTYIGEKDTFLCDHILEKYSHSLRIYQVLKNESVDKQADIMSNFDSDSRYYKPILRPLSDFKWTEENERYIDSDSFKWVIVNDISKVRVLAYNWLLENHYDVFGLIPDNLAIDINTINRNKQTIKWKRK